MEARSGKKKKKKNHPQTDRDRREESLWDDFMWKNMNNAGLEKICIENNTHTHGFLLGAGTTIKRNVKKSQTVTGYKSEISNIFKKHFKHNFLSMLHQILVNIWKLNVSLFWDRWGKYMLYNAAL